MRCLDQAISGAANSNATVTRSRTDLERGRSFSFKGKAGSLRAARPAGSLFLFNI